MDKKFHIVENIHTDKTHLYLTVDNQPYQITWEECSKRLCAATREEREHIMVSPSGYGLHWPLVDEDLAITPLLQKAALLEMEMV